MSRRPVSKSTKRRRFLEEVELADNMYSGVDHQPSTSSFTSSESFTIQPECVQESSSTESQCLDNFNISNTIDDEFINNLPIISFFDSGSLLNDECEMQFISDSDGDDVNISEQFQFFKDDTRSIIHSLAKWAVSHNITNSALSALLKCLKFHKCFIDLPVDARSVLKTELSTSSKIIQIIPPGIYHHFGIANGLNYLGNIVHYTEDTIRILVGIDGLPLAKSSCSTFWPILGCVRDSSNYSHVFLIGLYWGKEKPRESNIFLNDFVNELIELSKNGLMTKYGKKFVIVDGFCCDAPAKSFILKTKGHTGFFSCSRCTTEGVYLENRVCFPEIKFTKRTHSDFINRINDDYHVTNSVTLISKIPHLNIINDFPLDYLHLVCLGSMKKLILLWLGILKKAPLSVRLPIKNVQTISDHLLSIKPFVTSDFSRSPRGLSEVPRWKATEYRLFILYTGPIVLQGMIHEDCYSHFLCLHICFRILLTQNVENELIHFCEKLLPYFVEKFGKLYGKHFISHNIHGLLHIVDDYKRYGSLDNCSCFPFENYLQFLKKMVRKFEKPLEQVINRYNEFLAFSETKDSPHSSNLNVIELKKSHNEGPLIDNCTGPQFKCIVMNNFKINTKSMADCYIGFLKEGKLNICRVENICKHNDENVFIVKFFNTIKPFFHKPIDSVKLQIAIVDNLSAKLAFINVGSINFNKYMILYNSQNLKIAYPILHLMN